MKTCSKRTIALAGLVPVASGLALVLGLGCNGDDRNVLPPKEEAVGPPLYEDVTDRTGIKISYSNGEDAHHYSILESLGGGVALIDYDGDGKLDIFVPGGGYFDRTAEEYKPDPKGEPKGRAPNFKGSGCKLYKNMGGFKFKDVTKEVGLDGISFYTHGAAVTDYDRDGWPDLLVTGWGRVALFRNVPNGQGGRRFVEVTEEVGLGGKDAGALSKHFWATSAAWADLDGDGWPDLYICQYVKWNWGADHPFCGGYSPEIFQDVCPPKKFDALPHALYHNVAGKDGKRRFVDVSKQAGLRTYRHQKDYDLLTYLDADAKKRLKEGDDRLEFGKGLGVIVVDVDGDGKPDIFVANDTVDDFLYLNRSVPGKLQFEEIGFDLGVARDDRGNPTGSMGVDAGDPFGIGRASLWITTYENELHSLFRNEITGNQKFFRYSTKLSGIAAIGQLYVGFGTGFLDLDNDGWEDIFIANGHVIKHPVRAGLKQSPVLFRNKGEGRFEVITAQGGPYFKVGHRSRGVAIGDLSDDGRPDLVISNLNEPVAILRNIADTGNHWLGVKLARKDHADYVGARVTLEVNGRKLTRFAKGGGSYMSANDRRILFGLGKADKVGPLTVEWPSGNPRVERWDNLAVDGYRDVVQGQGKAKVTTSE
jgi:hypothetical protein